MTTGGAGAGSHRPGSLVPRRSRRRVPVVAVAGMLHPRPTAAAPAVPRRRAPARFDPARNPSRGVCYPRSTMADVKLSKKEQDDLRTRLLEEREELQTQLSGIEEDTFAATQSEMTGDVGLDDEMADAGTATFEREKDLSIEQNVRDLLQKIDRALKRMEEGTYGICDRCGKPIEKARIKALPYVDLCIKDAQARSRH